MSSKALPTPGGGAPLPAFPRESPEALTPSDPRLPTPDSRPRLILGGFVLVWLGLLLEAGFVGLWPLSYDLTQGVDFSYEYLLQYQQVWEFFRPIFERFEATFPTAATSLDQLTGLQTAFWLATFAVYITAFLVLRALPDRWWLVGPILALSVVYQVTFMLMPGTFTTDLFSYAMYGIIPRVYDLNPYIYVPGYFPGNRMTSWIHPVWYYTPSIYGPLWIDLSVWLTGFTRDRSLVDQALVYRLVSNLAQLVNLGLVGLLLRRLAPPKPLSLLLLFAWSPLQLFEFAGSGHNDSLMLTFVLLAGLLLAYRRHLLAVVALSLAALIKVTPIMVLPLLVLHWAATEPTWRRRGLALVLGGLVPVGLAVAFYLPWYSGPDTFMLIDYWSKGPMYLNYVPEVLAQAVAENLLDPARLDPEGAAEAARTAVKWVSRLAFLVYFSWELWRVVRRGLAPASDRARAAELLAAMSRVFLVFLLVVNTWVLSWYFTWPLVLAIPLGWRRLQTRLLTAFSLSAPLMMYYHHYWSTNMAWWWYAIYLAPLALLAWPFLKRAGWPSRGRLGRRWSGGRPGPARADVETAGSAS